MSLTYANYESILLGDNVTPNLQYDLNPFNDTGTRTATTVHQIYCLQPGTLEIYPFKCDNCQINNDLPVFLCAFLKGQKMDILVQRIVVQSGQFVVFRSKFDVNPFYSSGNNQ